MKNDYLKRKKHFPAYGHIQLSKKEVYLSLTVTQLYGIERWTVIMCIGDVKKCWMVSERLWGYKAKFSKKNTSPFLML